MLVYMLWLHSVCRYNWSAVEIKFGKFCKILWSVSILMRKTSGNWRNNLASILNSCSVWYHNQVIHLTQQCGKENKSNYTPKRFAANSQPSHPTQTFDFKMDGTFNNIGFVFGTRTPFHIFHLNVTGIIDTCTYMH